VGERSILRLGFHRIVARGTESPKKVCGLRFNNCRIGAHPLVGTSGYSNGICYLTGVRLRYPSLTHVHASVCHSGWLLIVPVGRSARWVVGRCESYEPDIPEPGVELPIILRESDQTAPMDVDSGLTRVL